MRAIALGMFSVLLLICGVFPFRSLATKIGLRITEIMYDVPGTDTKREWIEITNTSTLPVDVSQLKLFEANTNHTLTLVSGDKVVQPGSSAIIVDDPVKFKTDWPHYTGALFNSTFSLSNTGEALTLKDSALVAVNSVSYDHSLGGTGDGNTLQWNGTAFVPGAPTPGMFGAIPAPSAAPSVVAVASPVAKPTTSPVSYKKAQVVEQVTSTKGDPTNEEAMQAPAVTVEPATAGAVLPTSAAHTPASSIFGSPWLIAFAFVVVISGGAFILL